MKKLLSLLMSAAMLAGGASVFAGCGRDVPDNVLVVSRWASVYERSAFEEWGKLFEAENPGIEIQWNFNDYSNYFTKLRYDLLDDAAADVVFLSTWGWGPYRDSNVFVDLDSVDSLKDAIAGVNEGANKQFMKGEERLGVSVGITTRRIAVDTATFEGSAYDLSELQTRTSCFEPEEMISILGGVAQENGKKYALKMDSSEAAFLLTASAGAPIVNNATKTVDVDCEAGKAAVRDLVLLFQSGYVVPFGQDTNSSASGTFDEAMLVQGEQTVLTSYTGPWGFSTLQNAGKVIVTLPAFKATGGEDTMLVTYNNLCVPKASEKKDMAYKFIEWALSYEAQVEFAKFSDLPANIQAYEYVTGGTSEEFPTDLFGSFAVGSENLYYMDGMTDEFASAFSAAMSNLLNESYKTGVGYYDVDEAKLDAAIDRFCAALKDAEDKL